MSCTCFVYMFMYMYMYMCTSFGILAYTFVWCVGFPSSERQRWCPGVTRTCSSWEGAERAHGPSDPGRPKAKEGKQKASTSSPRPAVTVLRSSCTGRHGFSRTSDLPRMSDSPRMPDGTAASNPR